ncbi:MAG TPA: HEAT repeat domain-containing protein, partial [Rectinemataceae bacterium]|nr:HEAT repeat domain-containing protein [Rectinemataceae bacterium]
MNLGTEYILLGAFFLLWLDFFIVVRTLSNKSELALADERRSKELAELAHLFEIDSSWDKKKVRRLFGNYLRLKQSIDLPEEERLRILSLAKAEKIEPKLAKRIRSRSRYARMEAALGLALIADDRARTTLESALGAEKDFPVKLFIANALADIKDPRSLDVLTKSLLGAHRWYRDKVNMLIASFGLQASDYLRGYFWRSESEIVEMLVDIAGQCICVELKDYLTAMLEDGQAEIERLSESVRGCPEKSCAYCIHGQMTTENMRRLCPYEGEVAPGFKCRRLELLVTSRDPAGNHHRLIVKAAENLGKFYGYALNKPAFLDHSDKDIRSIAIRSLGSGNSEENIRVLLHYLGDDLTILPARLGL